MSGQNYIGSKISLISLSDIRYVGILHNINPVESTVALQNVKSYGTEGRKGNLSEEIRPADNTFDYVVFRGSDIKDLQVFEAPPSFQSEQAPEPVQQKTQFSEPVVNAAPYAYSSSTAAPYYSTPNMFSNGNSNAVDYGAPYGAAANYRPNNSNAAVGQTSYNPYTQQPLYQMPVPENYQAIPSAPPAAAIRDVNIIENGASPPSKKEYKEEGKTVASPKKEVPAVNLTSTSMKIKLSQEKEEVVAPVIEQVDEALLNSLVKQVSELDIKKPLIINKQTPPTRPQKQPEAQKQQPQTSDNNTRVAGDSHSNSTSTTRGRKSSTKNSTRNGSTRSNGNGNGQIWEPNNINGSNSRISTSNGHRNSSGNIYRRNSGISIPKSDFDFESSNAKFDKSNVSATEDSSHSNEEHAVIPDADHFYDKKKSFFDDISCESKEYQKGARGGKYKEESKLNLETFGQANPAGQNGKRGRHRGSRGRNHRGSRAKQSSFSTTNDGNDNHEFKEKRSQS